MVVVVVVAYPNYLLILHTVCHFHFSINVVCTFSVVQVELVSSVPHVLSGLSNETRKLCLLYRNNTWFRLQGGKNRPAHFQAGACKWQPNLALLFVKCFLSFKLAVFFIIYHYLVYIHKICY